MTIDRTSSLTLPLSILASVAVGAVLGHLFTRTDAGVTASTAVSIPDARDLVDAMHALRDEMSHGREPRNELVTPPVMPTRTDASQSADDPSLDVAKELREATTELARVVGDLRNALKLSRPELPPPVFQNGEPNRALVDADAGRPSEELNKSYLFWTYQQVADRFGAPTGTERKESGAIVWYYPGSLEGSNSLEFWFMDGRVFSLEGRT
jgi:hypothetical protein